MMISNVQPNQDKLYLKTNQGIFPVASHRVSFDCIVFRLYVVVYKS